MQAAVSKGEQDLAITFIACLVIIRFETFHGNFENAFIQITAGLRVTEEAARKNTGFKTCEGHGVEVRYEEGLGDWVA